VKELLLLVNIALLFAFLPGCRAPQENCDHSNASVTRAFQSDHSVGQVRRPEAETSAELQNLTYQPEDDLTSPRPIELPEEEEDSSDGLTLNAAIEQLLNASYDLAAKFQDIPKARADILSAGLRNDPVLFLSATQLPYQRYNAQRPGTPLYDITLVQPVDISGKHRASIRVAEREYRVLEARYQDAVRHEIDKLYMAWVDVLEARAARTTAKVDAASLAKLVEAARRRVQQGGLQARSELTALTLRKARAELAVQDAEVALRRARRQLAVLLVLPDRADSLKVNGSLHDKAPPPPPTEELIGIALKSRPDLISYRLTVERAQTQVRQARAEGIEDLFLFFSPYQASDLSAEGKQQANGWEVGILLPFPVLNRNQGNVARARANVRQSEIEAESVEQQVIDEVRRAAMEYEISRNEVQRYERDLLPGVRDIRDDKYRLYTSGNEAVDAYLIAQREYNDVVRQYWEALTRHRRAMLELNTAVGQRILP
jgi:cobalt-zinc-cadmium efflux system outer membrane protein